MQIEHMWDRIMEAVDTKSIRSPAQLRAAAFIAVGVERRETAFHRAQDRDMQRLYHLLSDTQADAVKVVGRKIARQ